MLLKPCAFTARVTSSRNAASWKRGSSSALTSFRMRFPWLAVNLVTAFVAASVVRYFEGTIERWAVLAAFMLCILPGFYVLPLLSFVLPVMVTEAKFGGDAMSRSAELTKWSPTGRITDSALAKALLLLILLIAMQVAGSGSAPPEPGGEPLVHTT